MPTERMEEVEVVCGWEPCGHCSYPEIPATPTTHPVVEGSLTAARLRLADAAEKWLLSKMGTFLTNQDGWDHHGRPWSPPTQGLSSAYAELAVLRGPMGATNDD